MNVSGLRRRVEQRSGKPIGDPMWDLLVKDGFVGDALIEEDELPGKGVDFLIARVREVRKALEDAPTPDERAPNMKGRELSDLSQRAVSIVLARYADQEADVEAFRQDVLGGQLLRPEDVEAWITRESEAQGEPTRWVAVPVPRSQSRDIWSYSIPRDVSAIKIDIQQLAYGVPSDDWKHTIDVRHDGVLGYLSEVSTGLAKRYPWSEAQSTVFILTGQVPVVEPASAKYHFTWPSPEVAGRIVLTVDPTLQPAVVRDFYARVRRDVVGGRYRPMSEKHMELAIFAAEQPAGSSWAERMREWNLAFGKRAVETTGVSWAYADVDRFTRECLKAQRRVLYPISGKEPFSGKGETKPNSWSTRAQWWRSRLNLSRSHNADASDTTQT